MNITPYLVPAVVGLVCWIIARKTKFFEADPPDLAVRTDLDDMTNRAQVRRVNAFAIPPGSFVYVSDDDASSDVPPGAWPILSTRHTVERPMLTVITPLGDVYFNVIDGIPVVPIPHKPTPAQPLEPHALDQLAVHRAQAPADHEAPGIEISHDFTPAWQERPLRVPARPEAPTPGPGSGMTLRQTLRWLARFPPAPTPTTAILWTLGRFSYYLIAAAGLVLWSQLTTDPALAFVFTGTAGAIVLTIALVACINARAARFRARHRRPSKDPR